MEGKREDKGNTDGEKEKNEQKNEVNKQRIKEKQREDSEPKIITVKSEVCVKKMDWLNRSVMGEVMEPWR